MLDDRRATILFIDSYNIERNYYANQLKQLSSDYVIYHAASGSTGLALCQARPIDIVVLEINLEDMSGFEVLAQLVTNIRYRDVAVIVLTHLTNPFLLEMATENGALAGLCKSFTPAESLDRHILRALSIVSRGRNPLKAEDVTLLRNPPTFFQLET
jgi:CheY-like chemotaxis protein